MNLRPGAKQSIIVIGDAATHDRDQRQALQRVRQFVQLNRRRNLSTLFVTTPSYLRFGRGDREYFRNLASAGRGAFNDHAGRMIESVLLSVLVD